MSDNRGRGRGRGRGYRQPSQSSTGRGRGYDQSSQSSTGRGRGYDQSSQSSTGRGVGYDQASQSSTGLGRGTSPGQPHYDQIASSSGGVGGRGTQTTSAPPTPSDLSTEDLLHSLKLQSSSPSTAPVESSKALRPPARPGFGTAGTKCLVRANHFLVHVADSDLHQYDVSISPEVSSKRVCRDIISNLVNTYTDSHLGKKQLAYDGRKSAYAAGALPFSSKEFMIKLVEENGGSRREREFKVMVKFAAKADLHHLQQFLHGRQSDAPQETIQVLDVVLRAMPSNNYQVVGRSFFHPDLGGLGELPDGLEYWMGYYQSLRPTQMGLSLNVDISARAFFQPIFVSDFVVQCLHIRNMTRPLSDQDHVKVKKAIKGLRVQLDNGGNVRRYKISGVSGQPMSELMFNLDDTGARVSVVQYFRQRYNIALKYPSLPALQAGTDAKPVYLPMELCKILEGQRYTRKLNEKQVAALLKATCQRPKQRENSIKQMVNLNNYNEVKVVNEFGIHVNTNLASIDARVLEPPKLMYHGTGKESQVQPRVGQWNMIDKKMVNGGRVDSWACVSFSRDNIELKKFCDALISMCSSKGMVFNPEPLIPFEFAHSGQIEKTLFNISAKATAKLASIGQTGKQLQLLIVILPDFSGSYGKIKRVCETELGIVSQCCQPRHAKKNNKQYLENVSLKINVKVGGRNTVLMDAIERRIPFVSDRPTIIFGADVTHPQPGEDSSPSIAAVVASMDWPEITKYRCLVSSQFHREEIIQDLYKTREDPQKGVVHSGMIRELLIAFRRSTGHKPHRIIFYRDGVSEGQFNQVLLYEMDSIRKACNSLEDNYLPPVTFVVVQKRHHTRLFAANHNDNNLTDRSGNILPGTVVDTKICHPSEFDFYLCSHSGIQGTSRPTHYHVLYDENKFSADALQILTNKLCYTYARCTRSVSIVPPAYYAHLAAFRARYYCEGETSETESSIGVSNIRERRMDVRPLPVIKENVRDVMFYC